MDKYQALTNALLK